jgi:hypothetical protein
MKQRMAIFIFVCILCSCTTAPFPAVSQQQILEFDFKYGGYFSGLRSIHINKTEKSFIEIMNDLGTEKNSEIIEINDNLLADFSKDLSSLRILEWKDEYINRGIMDGMSWSLKIIFNDERLNINKYGSNEYPYNWKDFLQVIYNYFPKMDNRK